MRKNFELFLGLLIGGLISITGVYAATIIKSKEVSYDNKSSGGKYTNVQDSIDELYEKVKDAYKIHDTIWKDKTLNGADPVLEVEGSTKKLIPITLDNDGTVHYANLYSEWYDYSDKRWANAVILVDNPKNGGQEKYTYKTGDIINENDIESYFVWIPRYSYKIWNMGNYNVAPNITTLADNNYATSSVQAFNKAMIIDIKFGDINANKKMDESQAQLNKYYTHPAFTLGDKDLNGIWVGKFETGYNQDGDNGQPITVDNNWTTAGAQKETNKSTRIIVKPNVYSWRYNTVQNFFLSSFNYERKLESHMMKNTEWGAVAYLSHSIYGIGSEVNINNNKSFVTGYSAAAGIKQETMPGTSGPAAPKENTDTTQAYNTGAGYLASTTGNITGVYDMSGGAWEYVAAYISGKIGSSGFEDDTELTTIYRNYVDIYSADSTVTSYDKRILGDATGELGPFYQYFDGDGTDGAGGTPGTLRYHSSWYSDYAHFIGSTYVWFDRGGGFSGGGLASQFDFSRYPGGVHNNGGSRLVLSLS